MLLFSCSYNTMTGGDVTGPYKGSRSRGKAVSIKQKLSGRVGSDVAESCG